MCDINTGRFVAHITECDTQESDVYTHEDNRECVCAIIYYYGSDEIPTPENIISSNKLTSTERADEWIYNKFEGAFFDRNKMVSTASVYNVYGS